MQAGKEAMASVKETVANVGASAVAGKEKTKATIMEKVEKLSAEEPVQKEAAEQKKQERIHNAEVQKQEAMQQNAAAREQVRVGYHPTDELQSTTIASGQSTSEAGYVESGVARSRPISTATGTLPELHGSGGGYE